MRPYFSLSLLSYWFAAKPLHPRHLPSSADFSSSVEFLNACLYRHISSYAPKEPKWFNRTFRADYRFKQNVIAFTTLIVWHVYSYAKFSAHLNMLSQVVLSIIAGAPWWIKRRRWAFQPLSRRWNFFLRVHVLPLLHSVLKIGRREVSSYKQCRLHFCIFSGE